MSHRDHRAGRTPGERRAVNVAALVARATQGSPRAVARLISLVEDAHPALREVMAALTPHAGSAWVIGLTGAPGVGKSTTVSALVGGFRRRGLRVGVLAVDPSSPFSGGALLGDRVRMEAHTLDGGVYIRSMATRGRLGGLAWATPQAVRVLDAAGCDVVVVETVGVGQSEVEVAALADTTVVLLAPGMGDGIQAAKAGILEIADVFVVNKADHDGVDATVCDLRHLVSLGAQTTPGRWRPPVCRTSATQGVGIDELVAALDAHRAFLETDGALRRGRERRVTDEIEQIAMASMRARFAEGDGRAALHALAADVVDGRSDPYAAADLLLSQVSSGTDHSTGWSAGPTTRR